MAEKHNFTGSFNFNDGNFEFCCESFPTVDDSIKSPQRTFLLALNLTSNITSNFINEVRFGGNRSELFFNGEGDPGVGTANVDAIRAAFIAQGASFPTTGFGGANGSLVGFTTSGPLSIAPFDTQFRFTGTTVIADSMNWIKGDHNFKFGFEHRRVYTNGASNFGRAENLNLIRPPLSASRFWSMRQEMILVSLVHSEQCKTSPASSTASLDSSRSHSISIKTVAALKQTIEDTQFCEFDLFFEDTWEGSTKLHAELRLTLRVQGRALRVNGQMSTLVNQDPSSFTPAGGFVFQLVGKNSPTLIPLKLYENDYNNFAPRFGFKLEPWLEQRIHLQS